MSEQELSEQLNQLRDATVAVEQFDNEIASSRAAILSAFADLEQQLADEKAKVRLAILELE